MKIYIKLKNFCELRLMTLVINAYIKCEAFYLAETIR